MRITCLSLLIFAGTTTAQPQEPSEVSDTIVTDRPDFTESPLVVPYRWFQFETGLTYEKGDRTHVIGGPEALLRYGFGRNVELRIGLPSYVSARSSTASAHGFGDTYLGFKFQLAPPSSEDQFALIPAVSLPTGRNGFSSETVDPELKVCWGRDLPNGWSVSSMAYGAWIPSPNGGRQFQFQQTLSFARAIGDQYGLFIEYAGLFARGTGPAHVAHLGFTYNPTPHSLVDIHFGFTMNGGNRNPFVGGGYSWRF